MNLNEAKTVLKNAGYKLIKESEALEARKEYSWNGSTGMITVSYSKSANIWLSITNDTNDEELDTVALPAMFKKIEAKYGLKAISAQDFPIGQNGFNSLVVYTSTGDVDLNELCEDIYQELNID